MNVEVRHKKTYIKRDVLEEQNKQHQDEADLKRKELEAAEAAERERQEAARRESERMEAENRRRIEDEATRKKQAEEARRAQEEQRAKPGDRRRSAVPPPKPPLRTRSRRVPSATSPRRPGGAAVDPAKDTRVTAARSCMSPAAERAQQEEEARARSAPAPAA